MSFCHLHVHNIYSFGEAMGSPKDYAKAAKTQGHKALAMTNNGNICGVYNHYQACKEEGIKPIFGQEFYVAMTDDMKSKPVGETRQRRVVVLAKNDEGWANLMELSSEAWLTGRYYKPRVDSKILTKHKKGLIVLSGGIDGIIGSYFLQGEEKKALEVARRYRTIFGDDFYLEALPIYFQQQIDYNRFLLQLKEIDKYKIVAANCCYYVTKEQAKYYPYLLMVKNNMRDSDFFNRDRQMPDSLYYMSEKEMEEAFDNQGVEEADYKDWISRTVEVADKIEEIHFETSFKLPSFLDFNKKQEKKDESSTREASLFDEA